jgi:hypothetical protein
VVRLYDLVPGSAVQVTAMNDSGVIIGRSGAHAVLRNPCDTPMMKKLFRNRPPVRWNTTEKDTVDEIIFETTPRYLGKVCDVEAIRWIDNLCS